MTAPAPARRYDLNDPLFVLDEQAREARVTLAETLRELDRAGTMPPELDRRHAGYIYAELENRGRRASDVRCRDDLVDGGMGGGWDI